MFVIKTGLESFIAGAIDVEEDDNGLIILICFGMSGTVSPLFMERTEFESESVCDVEMRRMVDGVVVVSADLLIERRITRALFIVEGRISLVV